MPASNPACPRCNSNDRVHLTTPDYGYGYGAEFCCYNQSCSREGRFAFTSKTAEARAISDASRARSAANAAAYRRQNGGGGDANGS